jgi:hypothetical protein
VSIINFVVFSFIEAQREAMSRLGRVSARRRRSDAGRSRLAPEVLKELQLAALHQDPPSMADVQSRISDTCGALRIKPPSRASLYNTLPRIEGHRYSIALLPDHVAATLYNLAPAGEVPGHQLAFHCFNYGSLPAISYAASLPWLDLYQARRLRGWRPRSRGLLEAVLRARGLR